MNPTSALSLALPFSIAGMLVTSPLPAQETYRTPSEEIVQILEAPVLPDLLVSPTGEWAALLSRPAMLGLEEIAEPRLHLAGYRLNPRTNGPALAGTPRGNALALVHLEEGRRVTVTLPDDPELAHLQWSPDGRWLSFAHVGAKGFELWGLAPGDAVSRRLAPGRLNAAHGTPCRWVAGSDEILCRFVPDDRVPPPDRPLVPAGPRVQESTGDPAPARTFQDLLLDEHEANLFEHYYTSQLMRVEVSDGRVEPVGEPAILDQVLPAPDGSHVFVSRTVRPFSFVVPDRWRENDWFPREMEVWDRAGNVVSSIASLPLEEDVAVYDFRTGPREVRWQPGEAAALVWVEHVDREGGEGGDRVYRMDQPEAEPAILLDLADRLSEMAWTDDGRGLITEVDRFPLRAASWTRTWLVDVDSPEEEPGAIWDRSAEERFGNPGTPVTRGATLLRDGDRILLRGDGVTPEGEQPFLDRLDLRTGRTERLWQSDPDRYEFPVAVVDGNASRFVVRSESRTDPANYLVVDRREERVTALTELDDPAPRLQGADRQVLVYEREDGVRLAGVVYTPPDWDGETPLPTVLWAYPREFVSADAAGQVPTQDNRFTRISGASHMFFLLEGYAVFDGPSIAILGGATANDTYVEQLVSSTEAAVQAVVDAGISDPDRIGVGGHSYGGFMTANLLAHSNLFRAGIARSAAHNRTLTPFGFQNELRTLWEAPEVYMGMSPFAHAHQIEAPILLLHGADDPNPGTFPMQSERMFHALKGLGKVSRLVMLDYEDHGYGARESIYHSVAEMIDWFERYVKTPDPAVSREDASEGGGP